jgi:transcriptional regulator with XRE-family HTH domain
MAAGLTQEELAEALSVSVKYVQRVERGTQNLGLDSMVKIANILKARMVQLLVAPRVARAPKKATPPKRRRPRRT